MKKSPTELELARTRIKTVGVSEMARRSGLTRRTLHYILAGTYDTKYGNVRKVLEAR